ncbi:MAG: hypothetical protein CMO55_02310 [Verrucomicrobiales bacterium]|nr:hypothetical protein [Verrucomicrobiales bacterium]
MISLFRLNFLFCAAVLFVCSSAFGEENLLDDAVSAPATKGVVVSQDSEGGIGVAIPVDSGSYPGVKVLPSSGSPWDLSEYAFVEARIRNTGEVELPVSLRVDNAGNWRDNPWNAESIRLGPGDSGTVRVFFGYSFGFQEAFTLDPSAVVSFLLFSEKAEQPRGFLIESIVPGGMPGDSPNEGGTSIVPENGVLFGPTVPMETSSQLDGFGGASVSPEGEALSIIFADTDQSASFGPPQGTWDLRQFHQIRFTLENKGATTIQPRFQIRSRAGSNQIHTSTEGVEPGATAEISVPFGPPVPWTMDGDASTGEMLVRPGTENDLASDRVTGVSILPDTESGVQRVRILSIVAESIPADLPDWLGTRPPVDGDWVETFREEFNGSSVDDTKWNIYTANYWDKKSHFSKDNVVVKDGTASLRFERKTGKHNDEPDGEETDYQTGYLGTFGKWTQKYGYFEARMKLPSAPGLWPAFWMMPDRGEDGGNPWRRSSTGDGGMEFDIMEYLSRWGPHRYNIAFHWDGYNKGHKHFGTSNIYTAVDKEGYITTGLLWLPGEAKLFCNGVCVGEWKSPRVSNVPSHLLFTHVSGGWDNSPLDDTLLPDVFVIDYVRCWQRKDLAGQ